MSESEHPIPRPERHWLRPLKGHWRGGNHLLLWPEEKLRGNRVTAPRVTAKFVQLHPDGSWGEDDYAYRSLDRLDSILDQWTKLKGPLTIWLPSGWEHLALSGLAELIDKGVITWRYANIDTHKVLIRGLYRGKSIVITSLSAWTGNTWDQWMSKTERRGWGLFQECWLAIMGLSKQLGCGSLAPSAGAAGMLLWRGWLGPHVRVQSASPSKIKRKKGKKEQVFVGPIPRRPEKAIEAERHCAYGLVHRQMRQGHLDGPVHCVDLRGCYLLSLATTPIPVLFRKKLYKPSVPELVDKLSAGTGCALVQLHSPETPYPVRREGRVQYAIGTYWTWLAGAELAWALMLHHVKLCECAYLWSAVRWAEERVNSVLSITEALTEMKESLKAAAWRNIYSHLIGRFAGWRREWQDCPSHHNFGRWAAWLQTIPETGEIVQHRSIAGRCQRLVRKEEATDSVPLLFGCVTAQGRLIIRRLCELIRWSSVLAIEADSIWVDRLGLQQMMRKASELGMPGDAIAVKETFDQVWMTGASIALVEMDGKKYLRCPGIPSDIAVGRAGDIRWPEGEGWAEQGDADRELPRRRTERRFKIDRFVKENSEPAGPLPYAEVIDDPMLPESLLQPVNAKKSKGVENDGV